MQFRAIFGDSSGAIPPSHHYEKWRRIGSIELAGPLIPGGAVMHVAFGDPLTLMKFG
jgi:hypothetical protein